MNDAERLAQLERQLAEVKADLKASQPTVIDEVAAARHRDQMHQMAEARASAYLPFSREDLAAMRAACPDDVMRDIAMRDNRGTLSPKPIIPTSQKVSDVRVGSGTGWTREVPLKNGLGQGK